MHYYSLVVLPKHGDLDELLAETLAPYSEDLEAEEYVEDGETYTRNPHGLWDWWQIGGRYSGRLSGFNPREDPAYIEECFLCHGTGRREDAVAQEHRRTHPEYGCNGCKSTGKALMWSSSWPRHDGDVVDLTDVNLAEWVSALADNQLPFTIFAHGSESVALKERWDGEQWVDVLDKPGMRVMLFTILEARARAGLADRVVVVDYHD